MKNKEGHPLYITIATQKGGVGKSTMTAIIASILHYRLGYNVICMDVDYPQVSLYNMRIRDVETIKRDGRLAAMVNSQIGAIGGGSYPILPCKASEAITKLNSAYLDNVDVILFDMPGTINQPGVIELLSNMDYIFLPIIADNIVMRSALAYALTIQNTLVSIENPTIKKLSCFWTRVDGRERSNRLYDEYTNKMGELGVDLMETSIPNSIRFNKEMSDKEIVRSTVLPPSPAVASDLHVSSFTNEILEICQLRKD